ncbi:MAG: response regulator [Proteobacteria bacterium]|jgi:DNA-binding NtrC family response regulator|nr:response regulator [Pseudomonadota bacterium]
MSQSPVHRPLSLPTFQLSRRATPTGTTASRILVVDNDAAALLGFRRILQGRWCVDAALGANAAASLLAAQEYRAVLTDYEMPGYNGIWLLEQVRRLYPRTLRILVSGATPSLFLPHVRSGLIQRFVPTPASAESLVESLAR